MWHSIIWQLLLWISFCPSRQHWVLLPRSCLCDNLNSNFVVYIKFLTGQIDNNGGHLRIFLNVQQLHTPGTWSDDAGDLLPLALVDWSRRTVKLFTSNTYRPAITVRPQDINNESQFEIKLITLSLLDLEAPHYETVFPLSLKAFQCICFQQQHSRYPSSRIRKDNSRKNRAAPITRDKTN